MIRRIEREANKLLALLSGIAYMIAMVLICISVALRELRGQGINDIEEITGYLVLTGVFLSLGYTLSTNGHVRTDLVLRKFPYILRIFAELLYCVLGLAFAIFYLLGLRELLQYDLERGLRSESGLIAQWVPVAIMLLGLITFAIAFLSRMILVLKQHLSGNRDLSLLDRDTSENTNIESTEMSTRTQPINS